MKKAITRPIEKLRSSSSFGSRNGRSAVRLCAAKIQKAIEIQEKLTQENLTITESQSELAKLYNSVGILQNKTRDREAASASHRKALGIHERLARENPSVTAYQSRLARGYMHLGHLQKKMGQNDAALVNFNKAMEIQGKLARDVASSPAEARLAVREQQQAGTVADAAGVPVWRTLFPQRTHCGRREMKVPSWRR